MKIKFMSWNILYGKFLPKVIKLVKELQPDILALQEATTYFPYFGLEDVNILEKIQEIVPDLKHQSFAPTLKKTKGERLQQMGNAILSKHKIITKEVFYFHTTPHWGRRWWYNQARNLLKAKIKIKDKHLFVCSTHLSFIPFLLDTKKRLEEAEQIIKIVKGKKPLIMGGDFNGVPSSKVVRRIKEVLNSAAPQNQPTFSKFSFSIGGFKFKGIKYQLDHVFYSQDLKIKECRVLPTKASDHFPVMVEFEI